MTKGSASISDLSEIETRKIFPYTNCIIQLISSSSSGSWSRIAGSQQFNIKTCVCLLPQCYWHLLDWPTVQQYPAIMRATLVTDQWLVLSAHSASYYSFRTNVKPVYSHVWTRGHVSYKKYLTCTSTILLTTVGVLWSKAIGAVFKGKCRFLVHDTL